MFNITLRQLPGRLINLRINGYNIIRSATYQRDIAPFKVVTSLNKPLNRSSSYNSHITQHFHTSSGLWSVQVINVPPFADSITEGDAKFLVKVGAQISVDEVVAEIETDKTTVPVPSPCAGVVKEFLVNEGDTVKPGQPLYKIEAV